MKNKRIIAFSTLLLTALFATSFATTQNYQKADSAYEKKQLFADKFDGDEINDNWTPVNDIVLEQQYSSMRFIPKTYNWTSVLSYHEQLTGNYKVSIDLQTSNMGGWFAVSFGNTTSNFTGSKGGLVFFDNNFTKLLTRETGSLEAEGEYVGSPFGTAIKTRRTVEIQVTAYNSEQSKMQCWIYENGDLICTLFDSPVILDRLDGYFGFNNNLKEVEIFNVKIYDGSDQLQYSDNFSTSKILYPSSGSSGSEWESTGFNETDVKVGFVSSLFADDINSGVVYNNPLVKPTNQDLDLAFIIESEIQYYSIGSDIASGIEINKKDASSRGYFFGIERLFIGYSLSIFDPSGNEIHKLTTDKENASLSVNLVVEIYLNGDIVVHTSDISYSFRVNSYEGYIGLMTYATKDAVQHGDGAYFNAFTLYKNDYYKRTEEDIFHNFNGVKRTYYEDIDEYVSDYYLSRKDFDIGANVSISKWNRKDQGDGKLEFNNAIPNSYFGPKGLYKDFVIKCDVKINSTDIPVGGCLGLKFGNSINGDVLENSKSIGIEYAYGNGVYQTIPHITNVKYVPGAETSFVDEHGDPVNIFADQQTFKLMFICRDNKVSLHYCLEGEDENNLGKVRTCVECEENENTDGRMAIYGCYGISFSIDNLQIINLDYDVPTRAYSGTSNYQEVTRLDFSKSEDTNGLELTNAGYSKNKVRINNGGVLSTSKLVNNGLVRFKVADIENELEIKQDQLKVRLLNDGNPRFVISDSTINQVYELGSSFQFRDSTFEIQRLNNQLTVRYASGDGVISVIDSNVATFEINAPNTSSKLTMTSIGGFTDIKTYTFINLNQYATFVNRDYDPEKDAFNPWPVRPSIDEEPEKETKGCKSSISATSLLIMSISLIGFAILCLLRRVER